MSGKTVLELVEENPELKELLTSLGWVKKEEKAPSFMDDIRAEEEKTVAEILALLQACEDKTGRSLGTTVRNRILEKMDPKFREHALQAIMARRGVFLSPPTPVEDILEQATATELSLATGNLKDLLIAVGSRAAAGKYTWKENFSAFMRWAQPVLQSAFDTARNQNFK